MGCGGSTLENDSPTGLVLHKRDKITIHLHVGKDVKVLPTKPQVIVVFGGPGSRKGKLLDDVSHVYGLKLISTETILIEELSKKLDDPTSSKRTEDIAALIKTQPELLRLQWVFSQVCNKIEKEGKNNCFLWDFMPNLKFLMAPFRNAKECENDFKIYENKFPISFAINFTVTNKKNIMAPQCAVPVIAEQKDTNTPAGQPKQSDEADTGRLAKRARLYAECVEIFTEYFSKREKLVSMDVSSKAKEDIWDKVCEFFSNLEIPHVRNVDTVIFFIFDDKDAQNYHTDFLDAKRVNVRDMAVNISAPPERIIPAVCKYIDDTYPIQKKFIVDLHQSSITRDCMKKWVLLKKAYKSLLDPKKVIQFRDIAENVDVQRYIPLQTKSKHKLPKVSALCSSENEVCLFPSDVPHGLCKYVAGLYRTYQEVVISRST
ncbi:uncharacterized protein LOC133189894 isoform X1 [Saccostrea echinata]|uniref:uncharacterized protein LOC133189894 isoform X1 n=1 Tax=Saccostrea echinata TaxID=191078 RepID=UPI002A81AB16|nr:uncharacterized protein LOC133189894 isoform X1 [Saccostrea echinata]